MRAATGETAPKRLFQTPQRNSPETMLRETTETIEKQTCNKAKQHRNNAIFPIRNNETVPYRGGEIVSPPRARHPAPLAPQQRYALGGFARWALTTEGPP
jgi:hypothetical protein